ncbi:MAG: HAMP domain-containing histidine kinase [Bacteroidales bacterium]|nr:HAMP domain-containing histidine kinase [Bacteroidales bacterium]
MFFHDLLNKAGSIDGLIDIITNHNPSEQLTEKYQSFVQRGMKELLQDISFQRDFLRAERGELIIRNQDLQSASILKNIADDFKGYLSNKSFNLVIDPDSDDCLFKSDPVVIIRILTNLTKNAIEAIETDETVTLKAEDKGNTIVFSVHNPTVMPEEIQLRLFKRSFSTKGAGRGIGTYSVKLFSEKYLKGKVWFNSTNEVGTTFFVELPKNN